MMLETRIYNTVVRSNVCEPRPCSLLRVLTGSSSMLDGYASVSKNITFEKFVSPVYHRKGADIDFEAGREGHQ